MESLGYVEGRVQPGTYCTHRHTLHTHQPNAGLLRLLAGFSCSLESAGALRFYNRN